jgi:hypothetical protein
VVNDRDERLASRLGTPLPSERAAAERNWRALSAAIASPPPSRLSRIRAIATTAALAAIVLLGLGWWEGARVDVAGDRLPVLYREEVARTGIAAPGIEATLVIEQKHIESDARLRVVGVTDVRIGADRLPATIELRFQLSGADTYGVLAKSEVSDPRRATGTTRTLYEAPFPPLAARDTATYRVWLHVESATGVVESPVLVIRVTDQPEGQRASDRNICCAP